MIGVGCALGDGGSVPLALAWGGLGGVAIACALTALHVRRHPLAPGLALARGILAGLALPGGAVAALAFGFGGETSADVTFSIQCQLPAELLFMVAGLVAWVTRATPIATAKPTATPSTATPNAAPTSGARALGAAGWASGGSVTLLVLGALLSPSVRRDIELEAVPPILVVLALAVALGLPAPLAARRGWPNAAQVALLRALLAAPLVPLALAGVAWMAFLTLLAVAKEPSIALVLLAVVVQLAAELLFLIGGIQAWRARPR